MGIIMGKENIHQKCETESKTIKTVKNWTIPSKEVQHLKKKIFISTYKTISCL